MSEQSPPESAPRCEWVPRYADAREAFAEDPRPERAEAMVESLKTADNDSYRREFVENAVMYLLQAPGTAVEETRYRELASEAADLDFGPSAARLFIEIARRSPAAPAAEAVRKAKEALGVREEWPLASELFGEKAFNRREDYV